MILESSKVFAMLPHFSNLRTLIDYDLPSKDTLNDK